MFDKKAAVPFNEIRGALTFMIVFTFFILFFVSCSAFDAKKTSDETKVSLEDVNAAKSINNFLETEFADGKKASDILIDSYFSGYYGAFSKASMDYFSVELHGDWRLLVFDKDNYPLYDSGDYGGYSDSGYGIYDTESEAKILIPSEGELKFIKVLFQIRK